MKLQVQYNRATIISALVILLIAAAGYYFLLRLVLINQLDETLKVEEVEIYDFIHKNNSIPAPTVYKDQRISFESTREPIRRHFDSIRQFDEEEQNNETVRRLLFPITVKGQNFIASVTKSEESTRDLLWVILFLTLGLIVLLIITSFLINRFLLKRIWKPFTDSLSSIKQFNLFEPTVIRMQPTKITEFNELNESIQLMSEKVIRDYQSLKNFTDQASHEMQTPLAIINSKLDVLIQDPDLNEKSMMYLHDIYKAVHKLSRLGRSLLLLARIEDNQYSTREIVDMDELIREKESEFFEWIQSMELKVDQKLHHCSININRELADILVTNLFFNAIRHNEKTRSIRIETGKNSFSICNSGQASLDKKRIFSRFYKSENSEGSGLGLAIVRQICDQYGFQVVYSFETGYHCFRINF